MLRDLKAYPNYKASGVLWLGDVPDHWEVMPALAAYRPRLVRNAGFIEKVVLSLSYGHIVVRPEERLHGLVPSSFETYQVVDPGNIIVRTTDLQNDKTSLRVGYSNDRGIITSAYMCLQTTDRISGEFGYQFLNAYDLLKIIYGFGSGLRQNLDYADIKRMPVLVPPKSEQSAIVRFLHHADRQNRRYIHSKEKLIKLLDEEKQAIIHRAVTRGLDSNALLKPSGVEWLGDVPESWDVRRIASFSPVVTNGWVGPTRDILSDSGIPYIQSLHIKRGEVVFRKKFFVEANWLSQHEKVRLHTGDVVVVQTGDIGQAACIPSEYEGAGCHALIIIRTNRTVMSGEFLDLVLRSKYGFNSLRQVQTGALHPHLNCTWVREIFVPVPPLDEQERILHEVDEQVKELDRVMTAAKGEIDLLREYRTRLIADVVTGKLDVREAAANLPDGLDELEDLLADEILEGGEEVEELMRLRLGPPRQVVDLPA